METSQTTYRVTETCSRTGDLLSQQDLSPIDVKWYLASGVLLDTRIRVTVENLCPDAVQYRGYMIIPDDTGAPIWHGASTNCGLPGCHGDSVEDVKAEIDDIQHEKGDPHRDPSYFQDTVHEEQAEKDRKAWREHQDIHAFDSLNWMADDLAGQVHPEEEERCPIR